MYLVFLWFKLKFAKITTSTSLLSFTIFIFENYRHFRLKLRGKSHFVTFKMKNQRSIFKCATVKICLLWNVNHTRCKKLPVSKKKHSTRLWLMKLYVTNETSFFRYVTNETRFFRFVTNEARFYRYVTNETRFYRYVTNEARFFRYVTNEAHFYRYVTNEARFYRFVTNEARFYGKITNEESQ